MIRKLLFLINVMCIGLLSYSQQNNNNQVGISNYVQKATRETNVQAVKLQLSNVQKDSVRNINTAYFLGIAQLRDQQLTPAQRGSALLQLEKAREDRLKVVLTVQQYQTYIADKNAIKARLQHRLASLANQ
jgi:hypothetical protein